MNAKIILEQVLKVRCHFIINETVLDQESAVVFNYRNHQTGILLERIMHDYHSRPTNTRNSAAGI